MEALEVDDLTTEYDHSSGTITTAMMLVVEWQNLIDKSIDIMISLPGAKNANPNHSLSFWPTYVKIKWY